MMIFLALFRSIFSIYFALKFIFLFNLIISINVLLAQQVKDSQSATQNESKQQTQQETKNFSMTLAAFFQSQQIYRGAQVQPVGNAFIGPSFQFFGHFNVRGPSLSYTHFDRQHPWELEVSANFFNDNGGGFIQFGDHEEDHRNRRKDSFESGLRVRRKWGQRLNYHVEAAVFRDWISYQALYSHIEFGLPVLPFTTLSTQFSFSEPQTNRFLYGPETAKKFGHQTSQLSLALPFLPWRGILVNSISYSYLLHGSHRQADYVRGDSEHWLYRFFLTWNIL